MNQMLLALIVVSNLVIIFTRAAASASRINEVLDTEPSIDDSLSEVFMDQQNRQVPFVSNMWTFAFHLTMA